MISAVKPIAFWYFLEITYYLAVVLLAIVIIQENRKPLKTISWIMVLLLLPFIGMIIYFFLGHNFKKARLFDEKYYHDLKQMERLFSEKKLELRDHRKELENLLLDKFKIANLLLNNNKALLTRHNKVTVLQNGKYTFNTILSDIEKATSFIHLEYFIFADDKIGNKVKNALIKKAGQGVEVRFIFDDVGSWGLSRKFINELRLAGIKVYSFMPVRFPMLTSKINYRNHRKIIVIDGKVGFVGGINVADKYIEGHKKLGKWRDTHLRIEGEAVRALQLVFVIDWYFLSNMLLSDKNKYFPEYSSP